MLSPRDTRKARRKFENSRSYKRVVEAMKEEFPDVSPEGLQVSGGTFANPSKSVLVDFDCPDRYNASISGDVAGTSAHNVAGEVEDTETGVLYLFEYENGSVSTRTVELVE